MTESGLNGLTQQANEAAVALQALKGPAEETAASIEAAFGKAGESLARSLGRAARDGEISLGELASALMTAVNAAGGVSGGGSLSSVLGEVFAGLGGFAGARADGGPVTAGGAYLVGERGPEWFRPATAGQIETATGATINLTLNMSGGQDGLVRSEAQIAAALQRAARMGSR
ncbi:phage tail tape measure protein [Asticcacaulis sp. AND118]|uniref:phage tail tape measure protein n=1 Tax=Asticcacaulis sp. AND118 TaxID=2840468 RepID=UPI001CFF90A3|nr:phage tail tape measure protein [Asticcacaulis sp. AND118]UDF03226.1 phage tail tape measure protein [Asticcacaulis sp. AND118]